MDMDADLDLDLDLDIQSPALSPINFAQSRTQSPEAVPKQSPISSQGGYNPASDVYSPAANSRPTPLCSPTDTATESGGTSARASAPRIREDSSRETSPVSCIGSYDGPLATEYGVSVRDRLGPAYAINSGGEDDLVRFLASSPLQQP